MNRKQFHADMVRLIKALKKTIGNDYRADEESTTPTMSVTIGADANGWNYQTGDNSYSGGAYSFATWAVVTIDRRCRSAEIADDIVSQLIELDPSEYDDTLAPIFDKM